MKPQRALILIALSCASVLPAAAADRLEQWYNLMPKGTSAVIAVKNTPELLAAFAKQVEGSSGKVLLHCTVGSRASQVYAAYAMKHLGLSPDEAIRTMEPVGNWPLALERLTGEPLALVRRDAFIKAGFED